MENLPIEIKETNNNLEVFKEENLIALFDKVKNEVIHEVPDVDSKEGRARIKSLASKISSSKTAIDKPLRDKLREIKAQPKMLEKVGRENIQRFDLLKADILKPLEEAMKPQTDLLNFLKSEIDVTTTIELKQLIEEIEEVDLNAFWPELQKKAKAAKDAALILANDALQRAEQNEEIERLRAEQARMVQEEHDREVAAQAAEWQRKQMEREAFEAKQREQQLIFDAQEAKKCQAEAAEQAERDAIAAAELAAKQERERYEAEQEEAERLAKQRADDKENRIQKNRAALVALIAEGLSEEDGKKVIVAIAKGLVPNVRIMY